jgi:nitrate/nitrite transporter NarK
MQASGVFGRNLLGWVSDRVGSGIVTLRAVALTSAAATSIAFALTSAAWPLWATTDGNL